MAILPPFSSHANDSNVRFVRVTDHPCEFRYPRQVMIVVFRDEQEQVHRSHRSLQPRVKTRTRKPSLRRSLRVMQLSVREFAERTREVRRASFVVAGESRLGILKIGRA